MTPSYARTDLRAAYAASYVGLNTRPRHMHGASAFKLGRTKGHSHHADVSLRFFRHTWNGHVFVPVFDAVTPPPLTSRDGPTVCQWLVLQL